MMNKGWRWAFDELTSGRAVKRMYVSEHHTVKPFERILNPKDNVPVLVSDITACNWGSVDAKPFDLKNLVEEVGKAISEWEYRQK
jgi:hypothetical protein